MSDIRSKRMKYAFGVMFLLVIATGCEPVATSSATPTTNITVSDAPKESAEEETVSPTLLAQVQQLYQEVGGLRNRVELLEFELDKARKRQQQLYDDLDLRIRKFERLQSRPAPEPDLTDSQSSATQSSDSATQQDSTDENVSDESADAEPADETAQTAILDVDPQTIRDAYDDAFRTLKSGDFDESQSKFRQFVDDYPSSDLVDDAWYWIAEANYITKNYDEAVKIYQFVAREYPEYQRAHEALLKIGYIYYDIENYEEAQLYLKEVLDRFPASRSAFSAQRRLDKMIRDGNIAE